MNQQNSSDTKGRNAGFAHSSPLITISLFLIVLRGIIAQIESTGAIPGDEFYFANLLYSTLPLLRVLTPILILVVALQLVQRARAGTDPNLSKLNLAAAVILPISILVPICAALTIVFVVIAEELRDRRELVTGLSNHSDAIAAMGESLRAMRFRDLFRWWAQLAELAAIAAIIVSLTESYSYSASFAGDFFEPSVLQHYRIRLIDLGLTFGASMSVFFLLPILATLFICRWRKASAKDVLNWAITVISASACGFFFSGLMAVIGDELTKTGVFSVLSSCAFCSTKSCRN